MTVNQMKSITYRLIAIFTFLEQKGETWLSREQISKELNIPRKAVNDYLKFLRSEGMVEMLKVRPTPFYRIHPTPSNKTFTAEIETVRDRLNSGKNLG